MSVAQPADPQIAKKRGAGTSVDAMTTHGLA
jgi:hypothetical protein